MSKEYTVTEKKNPQEKRTEFTYRTSRVSVSILVNQFLVKTWAGDAGRTRLNQSATGTLTIAEAKIVNEMLAEAIKKAEDYRFSFAVKEAN